jgi:hypothetical protein
MSAVGVKTADPEVNVCSHTPGAITVPLPHAFILTAPAGETPMNRLETPAVATAAMAVDVLRTASFTSSPTQASGTRRRIQWNDDFATKRTLGFFEYAM